MTDCFLNYYFSNDESGRKRKILKMYKERKCLAHSKRLSYFDDGNELMIFLKSWENSPRFR